MKYGLLILCLGTAFIFSACTPPYYYRCRKWHLEGYIMPSFRACEQCASELGGQDPQQVQGCAIGLEASKLLELEPVR